MLFISRLQSLITFKRAAFVKANIVTSFWTAALECYISELNNVNRHILNNNLGVKSWINTLSHCFEKLTSIAFGLFTNETYFLNNTQAQRPFVQYVYTIMQYGIKYNIVDVANQLSFVY